MGTVQVGLLFGGVYKDVRGVLRFVNDFDMSGVKRFYTVANSVENPKRGWIMHRRETKWFFPTRGVTRIEVMAENEAKECVKTFILDAAKPLVLQVPPLHWFLIDQSCVLPSCSVSELATLLFPEVMVFSDCHVGEFPEDDFRK